MQWGHLLHQPASNATTVAPCMYQFYWRPVNLVEYHINLIIQVYNFCGVQFFHIFDLLTFLQFSFHRWMIILVSVRTYMLILLFNFC